MAFQHGFDWHGIKFLESTENLKDILFKAHNRQISRDLAREIKACLQQGRSFFEIAEVSPLEIKPLQLFYGMVGFGRALSTAKSLVSQDTVPRSHGIKDSSESLSLLQNHKLKFQKTGNFQVINDSAKFLENAFLHVGHQTNIEKIQKCDSMNLQGKTISLKDIFARTQELENLFEDTFEEKPKVFSCSHFTKNPIDQIISFDIYYFSIQKERTVLKESIKALRSSFPFLNNWRFNSANFGGFGTTINFSARSPEGIDEFGIENLRETYDGFYAANLGNEDHHETELPTNLHAISGSLHGNTCIIEPFEELHLSELSLYYLGMFILSSLVRYRPNIWSNAISGRSGPNEKVDDKCLAVIEKFLTLSDTRFPAMIEQAFERIKNMN